MERERPLTDSSQKPFKPTGIWPAKEHGLTLSVMLIKGITDLNFVPSNGLYTERPPYGASKSCC